MDDLFSYAARKARERQEQAKPQEPKASPAAKPEPEKQQPLTVSQANARARNLLENTLGRISVVGEVSGRKRGAGGHWYFALKDTHCQLSAVMFRREATRLKFDLEDGMEVVAHGRLTVYPAYGRYQMMVERLEPMGAGALQAAFEQLKAKLREEGLFAPDRKRPLPLVPRRVGVVTSANGAVIRDIIHVSRRRFPNADILLIPCAVQGADSSRSIARAIRRASRHEDLNVLIVGRGGGSLEDLWGFNGETVARAIADSPIPVVSAVGHETDFTIADFVADLRAPTPSAAAELVFPVARELRGALRRDLDRGERALRRGLAHRRQQLASERHRLGDARGALREYSQSLSFARSRIDQLLRDRLNLERARLDRTERRLEERHPRVRLQEWRNRNEKVLAKLDASAMALLADAKARVDRAGARLHALSPLAVLERGYSIVLDEHGGALRDAGEASVGQRIRVRLHRGALDAEVKETLEPSGE